MTGRRIAGLVALVCFCGAYGAGQERSASAPRDYEGWTDLGVALAHQGRYKEAITAYRKALESNPRAAATQLDLGLAYFKLGDFPAAAGPLRAAAEAMPGNAQVETLLGMSLYGSRNYGDAAAHLSRVSGEPGANSELMATLAKSFLYSRQYDKALGEFAAMLRRDPESAGVHMFMAEAYDAQNRTAEAIGELRAALKKGYVPDAHFGIGYILWRDRRYDDAAAEFRKELEGNARQAQALAYLGDVEMKAGKPDAKELLGKAVGIEDGIHVAHLDLGILAAKSKRYAEAEAELLRAIAIEPKSADGHYRLARVYQATGRPGDAKAEMTVVKRLHERRHEDLIEKISGPEAAGSAVRSDAVH